jgi:hypothetical protein
VQTSFLNMKHPHGKTSIPMRYVAAMGIMGSEGLVAPVTGQVAPVGLVAP